MKGLDGNCNGNGQRWGEEQGEEQQFCHKVIKTGTNHFNVCQETSYGQIDCLNPARGREGTWANDLSAPRPWSAGETIRTSQQCTFNPVTNIFLSHFLAQEESS